MFVKREGITDKVANSTKKIQTWIRERILINLAKAWITVNIAIKWNFKYN